MIRVGLVDDHRVVSRGVKTWLESFEDIRVTGIAISGEEALAVVGRIATASPEMAEYMRKLLAGARD